MSISACINRSGSQLTENLMPTADTSRRDPLASKESMPT